MISTSEFSKFDYVMLISLRLFFAPSLIIPGIVISYFYMQDDIINKGIWFMISVGYLILLWLKDLIALIITCRRNDDKEYFPLPLVIFLDIINWIIYLVLIIMGILILYEDCCQGNDIIMILYMVIYVLIIICGIILSFIFKKEKALLCYC